MEEKKRMGDPEASCDFVHKLYLLVTSIVQMTGRLHLENLIQRLKHI